ncbi:MAG: hypothetical protein WAT76_13075, partial [Dokdonella sp.]|uniref:hypothetical protein n=1 Tax=Dokdonella sp. TaxID=2291710 RepID=UPI003BAEE421
MHITPSFQLTCPPPPAWDAHQGALFASDGRPTPSPSDEKVLQARVERLLDDVCVPASHRPSFMHALCAGVPVDPGFILCLSAPGSAERWQARVDAFDPSDESAASASVRARASALLRRAEATRSWPRSAITVLRRQRTESGAFDLATFSPLPPLLRPWRHILHTVAMQTRALLYDAFAKPADVSSRGKMCSVVVLGCFRMHFDFEARDIHVDQLGASRWNRVPNAIADLLQPLPNDAWCRGFALRLRRPVRVALGKSWGDDEIREAGFGWLADVVKKLTIDSGLLEHVRDLLREAYPCDPQIVRDALACTIDYRPHQGLTTQDYVAAWRNAEILRTRVAEAPELAAVWGLGVRAGYLKSHDDYDVLRRLFQSWEVTPVGWKLLIRHARQLYRPLIGSTSSAKGGLNTLACYVCLLQRIQSREPLPFPLAKALFAPYWFSEDLDLYELPLGLIRGATERIKGAMALGSLELFIEHEFVPVLGWIARAEPTFDSNQQCASWNWFFTRYQQWCKSERRKREDCRWESGIDGLRWRGFHITPIRDSVTLWSDGEQMRMCLNTYEEDCVMGRYIIYVVRAAGRMRPVAHIGLHLNADGTAEFDQVRGFANSPVEPALAQYAR